MIETLHRVHSFSLDVSSRAATARRSRCDFSCITYVCIVSVIKTHSIHHRSNHEMIVPDADVVESIRVDAMCAFTPRGGLCLRAAASSLCMGAA